jgi:hypothetical protein
MGLDMAPVTVELIQAHAQLEAQQAAAADVHMISFVCLLRFVA